MYWTLKSLPELAPLPAKERIRVWRGNVDQASSTLRVRKATWCMLFFARLLGLSWICVPALFGVNVFLIWAVSIPLMIGVMASAIVHQQILFDETRKFIRLSSIHADQ
jgi:apolipoprotein N-acyltransferase